MATGILRRLIVVSVLVGVLVLSPWVVLTSSAAEYGSIGGRPANPNPANERSKSIFVHEIQAGGVVADAIEVVNYTDEAKTLLVYATDAIVSSGGAFGCAQKVDELKNVGQWVQMSQTEVTLEPQTTQIVPFTINVPATANVGENNGCIVVQERQGDPQQLEQDGGSIAINFRTAVRVAILVPGDITKSIKILGYAATKNGGEYTLKPRVKNDGNVSSDTEIKTITSGLLGERKVETDQTYPVLRGATSDWGIAYKPSFWGGWVKSHFTATYDANINNSIGDTDNQQLVTLKSNTIYFFVMPHPIAIIIELLLLIGLGYGGWRLYGAWKKRRRMMSEWQTIVIEQQTDIVELAKSYGIAWKTLARANKLQPPYILRPGTPLRVPAKQQGAHSSSKHASAETITINDFTDVMAVAKERGIAWKTLARANKLQPPYILRPGDTVILPAKTDRGIKKLKSTIRQTESKPTEPVTVASRSDIVAFAEARGLEWQELVKINHLKAPYVLQPGDKVLVPKQPRHTIAHTSHTTAHSAPMPGSTYQPQQQHYPPQPQHVQHPHNPQLAHDEPAPHLPQSHEPMIIRPDNVEQKPGGHNENT